MCWECFKKYTDKPVWNDRVSAVAAKIKYADERYGEVDSSQVLHAIVADMNVDDWLFDLDQIHEGRQEAHAEAKQWERDIFDALKELTEEERATAVATHWGYIDMHGRIRKDIDDAEERHREYRIIRADQFGQFSVYADLVANGPAMKEGYAIINGEKVYIIGELELEES